MWLPFDLGKSSKRHEERETQTEKEGSGRHQRPGGGVLWAEGVASAEATHGSVWGALGERRVAGVGAGLWRVNANSKGRHCRDSFCARAAHVRIHLILATLQGRHFCYPHFTDGGVKAK